MCDLPVFLQILQPAKTKLLTVQFKSILRLFKATFSPDGANSRMYENSVDASFTKYLREVASKLTNKSERCFLYCILIWTVYH